MSVPVFLDRDGVINKLVFNPETGEYEAPQDRRKFELFPYTIDALKELTQRHYQLFLITNQPDYAKGKATMEELEAIHEIMHQQFAANSIEFKEYYYCYHHPQSLIPELKGSFCRKPNPYFLREAEKRYNLDLTRAWMVGDRDGDIIAGTSVGASTILIKEPHTIKLQGHSKPDYRAKDLSEAVYIIINSTGYSQT